MAEEIVLQTNDVQHEPLAPPSAPLRVISHQLVCRGLKSGESLGFNIVNNRFLEIARRHKATGEQQRMCFYLGLLEAKRSKRWYFNHWMAVLLLVAGLACAGGLIIGELEVVIASAVLAALCFYGVCRSFRYIHILRSAVAQAVLVQIPRNAEGSKAFVAQLLQKIRNNPVPVDVNAMAEETKMLREAMEKGFIKKADYEQYRAYILSRQ